mgnify:CR=1 FL=1
MSKLCKSCGNYYEGDHCDKCGYGDPNLKTHAADKYKKPTKPERFRTEEEKELYAEWEKEKKEDTEIKRHYDPNAGKKTLAIVAVVVIGVIVAIQKRSYFQLNKDRGNRKILQVHTDKRFRLIRGVLSERDEERIRTAANRRRIWQRAGHERSPLW